jgi:sulfur-carrier protein
VLIISGMDPNAANVTIQLPPALVRVAGVPRVDVRGASVAAALDSLDLQHPGLSDRVRTEAGEVRRHVLIYLNDTEVRELRGLETPLQNGDRLFVVAAVSGG